MLKKLNEMSIKFYLALRNQEGIGTVELILIVFALISLAIVFKNEVGKVLKKLIEKIDGETTKILNP